MYEEVLRQFGLRDKEINIYLTLLNLGSASVRKIAEMSGINRGTSYDVLRDLADLGLVRYFEKKNHQYFSCEDPAKLISILEKREEKIGKIKNELTDVVRDLQAIYGRRSQKPFVKYYEGFSGAKEILTDVLKIVSKLEEKEYYVYSTDSIRNYLYRSFKDFSAKRIEKNISVKVLAIGKGGELRGKDERKWIEKTSENAPNYIIIYGNKVAFISINSENEPMGIIIEDSATSRMQKTIFKSLWKCIK